MIYWLAELASDGRSAPKAWNRTELGQRQVGMPATLLDKEEHITKMMTGRLSSGMLHNFVFCIVLNCIDTIVVVLGD